MWIRIDDKLELNLMAEIGKGAFGVVYRGNYLSDSGKKIPVAVKKITNHHVERFEDAEDANLLYTREIEILTSLRNHRNIVHMYYHCSIPSEPKSRFVACELATNGDLDMLFKTFM